MKLLSFDIEISDVFDLKPGEDLDQYAPFHISVSSTAVWGGEERHWHSIDPSGKPLISMDKPKAAELLAYLAEMQRDGYMVCAWNGLGFDLRWIAHVAENPRLAGEIALKIYDPMFQFFNQRGFPVSLASVAQAMGVKQRKSMNAADAPKQWRAGNHQAVMDYVLGDCQITNEILRAIVERRQIRWITSKGAPKSEPLSKLKTVEEVLRDPEPDQSWMNTPLKRAKFVQWIPQDLLKG